MYRKFITDDKIKKPYTSSRRYQKKASKCKEKIFDKYYSDLSSSLDERAHNFSKDEEIDEENDDIILNDEENDDIIFNDEDILEGEDKLEDSEILEDANDQVYAIEDYIDRSLGREDLSSDKLDILRENLSELELCAALLSIFYAINVTQEGFKIVLRFTSLLVEPLRIPSSFDECVKVLLKHTDDSIDSMKNWFCPVCEIITSLSNCYQRSCTNCHTKLHAYHTFGLKRQLQRVFEKNCRFLEKPMCFELDEYIKDVYDGRIYQDFLKSVFGDEIRSKTAFTLLMNTDGIKISEKSNLSIWPIILTINE